MINLRRFFLIVMLVVLPPCAAAYAQTATPAPTATPDYRSLVGVGAVQAYGGAAPAGWLVCDGSAVSRTTYANLFAVIGTTFGAGDGSTTFNVPDLRGRGPIGSGTGSGLTARTTGQQLGNETHAMTNAELVNHTHSITDPGHLHTVTDPGHVHGPPTGTTFYWGVGAGTGGVPGGAASRAVANTGSATTGISVNGSVTGITINPDGGSTPFGIMDPSLVLNYYIWSGDRAMPSVVAQQTVIITVVVVFPTHTATPTPTPTYTPTPGDTPTPTLTPSPTGLASYESVISVAGRDVLMRNEVHPADVGQMFFATVFIVLLFGAFALYTRRRR